MAISLTPNWDEGDVFHQPFKEQVDYFKGKLNLPTNRWDDVLGAAHDRAFIVAGVTKAEMLDDFRREIDLAINEGKAFTAFQKEFDGIASKYGWDYKGDRDWRSRVIYSTNLSASYSAGRYAQLTEPSMLESHPLWTYRHNHGPNPRKPHLSWDGTTLPANHPWFRTHFTPNGWGCHCRIEAKTADSATITNVPDDGYYVHTDALGVEHTLPVGIDYGWAHAPGKHVATTFAELIWQKLIRMDAGIAAQMMAVLSPVMAAETAAAYKKMVDAAVQPGYLAQNNTALVYTLTPPLVAQLTAEGVVVASAGIFLRDAELLHGLRDAKAGRGLDVEIWRQLPSRFADAEVYLDLQDTALVFAFDAGTKAEKIVVRANYSDKIVMQGRREKRTANFIKTGGLVDAANLKERRYKKIK